MRSLKRFLISSSLVPRIQHEQSKAAIVFLPREETHHLKNVLRIKEGEMCLLLDSEGHEFVSRIERFLPDERSEVSVLETISKIQPERFKLSVAQAIPQDRKMDEIVRQAAELGIFEIIPLMTEHTVVRIHEEKSNKVVARWQRISDQTLKQSRLSRAPKILKPITFDLLCQNLKSYETVFILDLSSKALPIKEYSDKSSSEALIIIGPEGGFTEEEVLRAEKLGAKRVSLGNGILKTDTAFVAAASFLKLIWS